MKNLFLAVIVLASLAAAACHHRKAEAPRPDYDGARSNSERSQKSLDKEAGGYE